MCAGALGMLSTPFTIHNTIKSVGVPCMIESVILTEGEC